MKERVLSRGVHSDRKKSRAIVAYSSRLNASGLHDGFCSESQKRLYCTFHPNHTTNRRLREILYGDTKKCPRFTVAFLRPILPACLTIHLNPPHRSFNFFDGSPILCSTSSIPFLYISKFDLYFIVSCVFIQHSTLYMSVHHLCSYIFLQFSMFSGSTTQQSYVVQKSSLNTWRTL